MSTSELLLEEIAVLPAARPSATRALPPRAERRRVVAEIIQRLHGQAGGLSRVHHTHPALYARARRAFGTWRDAVLAAGLDYVRERDQSLRRGLSLRDQRRAAWRALALFLGAMPAASDEQLFVARPELSRRVRRLWGSVEAARAWAEENRRRAGVPDAPH